VWQRVLKALAAAGGPSAELLRDRTHATCASTVYPAETIIWWI
jgi:hypothetical protein